MSYVRLQPTDFVISTDSITMPTWTGNEPILTTFYTSALRSPAPEFYLDVYQAVATSADAEIQFSLAYGHISGSGSTYYNDLVPGYSPTRTVYGQYRTLVFGDENTGFNFGVGSTTQTCGLSTTSAVNSRDIYVINIQRTRYKEHLLPGSFNLKLVDGSGNVLQLSDNSKTVSVNTFLDCGRAFDIVSGSYGTPTTSTVGAGVVAGYTASGSYGYFLPDISTIILNPRALALSYANGGLSLTPNEAADTAAYNYDLVYTAMSSAGAQYFQLNSEESVSSDYIFVRVGNSEFNYTTNPSMISGSGEFIYSSFLNNPQTFITTVGLYNDNNELLAVAKTSQPLPKDFTKEALFRVKLDW